MQLSHTLPVVSATFDDPNLVSTAGLLPVMGLAEEAGLHELVADRLTVPGPAGSNAPVKISALVAGMVAGADSIDDMALLRHGGMGRVCDRAYAPSTLGSFLRSFAFGHVRQLDAVASRFLAHTSNLGRLAGRAMEDLRKLTAGWDPKLLSDQPMVRQVDPACLDVVALGQMGLDKHPLGTFS